MRDDMTQRIGQILDGLRFPAEKWEIVTCADAYGADAGTCVALHDLPSGKYSGCVEIARTLDAARTAELDR